MSRRTLTDKVALNTIADALSGKEWDADTTNFIARIVLKTGREVKDVDDD
jgi:hypothetical protein